MAEKIVELYAGKGAMEVLGYANMAGFQYARKRYPIPDQGYRVNGKPAWTREHLEAWRAGLPRSGPAKKS